MATRDDKRRLQLLPEVLPEPRADVGRGGPRDRTLAHLQRLLAMTAASTALGSGCGNKEAGAPDAGAPAATVESTAAATASAAATETASASTSDTAAPIASASAPTEDAG